MLIGQVISLGFYTSINNDILSAGNRQYLYNDRESLVSSVDQNRVSSLASPLYFSSGLVE